ncbi:hypothetical protein BC629DRAFT_1512851 [Irpex lacteus]|nr:hypothetical protein BC629DRAFT_1512851 [Irpex lacteus]
MLSVWKTAVALLSLLGSAVVRAQADSTEAVVATFDSDVRLEPAGAWRQQYNDVCLSSDVYTTTINATASLTFTGNRVQIYGMRSNASGRFTLQVDGQELHTYNLRSDVVQCELFVDDYLSDGTHNLTLTLAGTDNSNYTGTEGHASQSPVFHLTEILYYQPTNASSVPAPISSGSSATQKGAIAGVVIGVIVFIAFVFAALLFAKKKQIGPFRRGRHAFDPTRPTSAVYITELSPRSPRSESEFGDVKFAASPYARMEDDDGPRDVKAALGACFYYRCFVVDWLKY